MQFGTDQIVQSDQTTIMILRLITLLLLLIPATAIAQTPNPAAPDSASIYRAVGDSLRMAGDLPGAAGSLHKAYLATPSEKRGGEDGIGYTLASTLALIGNQNDHSFMVLEEILPSLTSMKVLHDPDMYFLVEDERWASVKGRLLDRLAGEVSGSFDRVLAAELLVIRRNEWVGRYHIMLLFRQSGGRSPALTLLSHGMGERHVQNEVDLISILDEKGWPKISSVGEEAAYAATNVLTHMGLHARQIYLPMLEAACEDEEADWGEYAPSLDRTELELGRSQVYGTQMEIDEELGEYVPRPLLDPGNVDERRAAIGMEPIADQLARFNAAMARDFGESR